MENTPINLFEIGGIKVSANKKLICDRVTQIEKVYMISVATQCTSTSYPIDAKSEQISLNFIKKMKPQKK